MPIDDFPRFFHRSLNDSIAKAFSGYPIRPPIFLARGSHHRSSELRAYEHTKISGTLGGSPSCGGGIHTLASNRNIVLWPIWWGTGANRWPRHLNPVEAETETQLPPRRRYQSGERNCRWTGRRDRSIASLCSKIEVMAERNMARVAVFGLAVLRFPSAPEH